MPTNLPPEYFEVEERYRAAKSPAEKAELLEELLGTIPKHKGTDKLRADLRRRLSKLKSAAQTKKGGGIRSAYQIDKEGAGQVVLVGPPNVGKSALVAALTNAAPEVDEAPYTTWTPIPGMMAIEDVQVQLIDTPPINPEFIDPEFLNLMRKADLIALVVDLQSYPIEHLEESVDILQENGILPCHLRERCPEERRASFKPFLVLANKADDESFDEDFEVLCELVGEEWQLIPVSAASGRNFEGFKWAVFKQLEIVRVYAKPPGEEPDYGAPFVLKKGATVEELAGRVHKDFLENLKSARVWGSSDFEGQMVSRDYVLHDGDVVELKTF
ncbi:MAG TPA: GTPase [Anaerolineales bacterium]|nr:GTPase [Anaerolineales bacterium]